MPTPAENHVQQLESASRIEAYGRQFIFGIATIYPKTNRYRLVFFRPFPPVLARVRGLASRAPPLQTLRFCTRQRLSVRRFLWWPRERARDLIHNNQRLMRGRL